MTVRIAICGGPRTGKTTLGERLAEKYAAPLISTDEYMHVPWERVPDDILPELIPSAPWILEGVQAARVIRRAIRERQELGLTAVYFLQTPVRPLDGPQRAMARGIDKVFQEVFPHLVRAGITVFRYPAEHDDTEPAAGGPEAA